MNPKARPPSEPELVRVLEPAAAPWIPHLRAMFGNHLEVLAHFDSTVAPQATLQSEWWQRPDELFAYIVLVDGTPAGFALVLTGAFVPAVGAHGDAALWEYFIAEPHRGTGLARATLHAVVRRHPGAWSVQTRPANARALGFWRRCLLGPPFDGVERPTSAGFAHFAFTSHAPDS